MEAQICLGFSFKLCATLPLWSSDSGFFSTKCYSRSSSFFFLKAPLGSLLRSTVGGGSRPALTAVMLGPHVLALLIRHYSPILSAPRLSFVPCFDEQFFLLISSLIVPFLLGLAFPFEYQNPLLVDRKRYICHHIRLVLFPHVEQTQVPRRSSFDFLFANFPSVLFFLLLIFEIPHSCSIFFFFLECRPASAPIDSFHVRIFFAPRPWLSWFIWFCFCFFLFPAA